MPDQTSVHLVDHLFRHEAGKMIAVLTRIFGLHHLDVAEDVVQESFLKALQCWKYGQLPDNPSAWLMQVAKNRAIDILRKRKKENIGIDADSDLMEIDESVNEFFHTDEIADSQLRMIFTCVHPLLNEEDQLALVLKTVSGFGVKEIAKALVTNEGTIQKRLYRAKEFIRKEKIGFEIPAGTALTSRLEVVHTFLYLLFNEGYNSGKADELIRRDLCGEAMRLCKTLIEHRICSTPTGYALLSMMCFHAARFDSRLDTNGIVLLQYQDRSKWSQELIQIGYFYLNHSAEGKEISVYHIESAIAAEHCLAKSFGETKWERLLQLYDLLLTMKPSPTVELNRAVVLAEMGEIQKAIEAILSIRNIEILLKDQYIYSAVLGDFYKRLSDQVKAKEFLEKAFGLTTSQAEKNLIEQKIKSIDPKKN